MLTPLLLALGLSGAALALDPTYAAYDALLQANVSPQGVTYAAIGPAGLDPFLAELAAVDLRELNPIEQKALFINAYNALTLDLIAENPGQVDGIKISLLDQSHEEAFRARLPAGVRLYTGDDFNYAELIAGDDQGYSHALLGIFDAIAPAAAGALSALADGDLSTFHDIFAPTVPLSRHIFKAPTRFYKTGVVFVAYLNGHQDHFTMVGGQESTRSTQHLAELFRLADQAGILRDPEQAAARMATVMAARGVGG